jgi:hypothetical protein
MFDGISRELIHCGTCEQTVHTEPLCGWPNQQVGSCDNCRAHIMYQPSDKSPAASTEGTKSLAECGEDLPQSTSKIPSQAEVVR